MEEKIYSLNLDDYFKIENLLTKEEKIDYRIKVKKLKESSLENLEKESCFYCEKSFKNNIKENGICNSHTIPRSFLDNISLRGEVNYFNSIYESDFMNKNKGLNNAGTFRLICRNCDRKIFKNYENKDNYNSLEPTIEMLAQIDIKNNLKNIDKCCQNIKYCEVLEKEIKNTKEFEVEEILYKYLLSRRKMFELDLKEFEEGYNYAKKVLNNPFKKDDYKILFCKKLDYVVPIAYQGTIALIKDLRGSIINNIYNSDVNYKIKNISVCIFPLETTSIIIIFTNKKNNRYNQFFNDFKKIKFEKQLSIMNYILFSYTEEYFLSPLIPEDILKKLKKLVFKTPDFYRETKNPKNKAGVYRELDKVFDYEEAIKFPNLLSEKFSINSLKELSNKI